MLHNSSTDSLPTLLPNRDELVILPLCSCPNGSRAWYSWTSPRTIDGLQEVERFPKNALFLRISLRSQELFTLDFRTSQSACFTNQSGPYGGRRRQSRVLDCHQCPVCLVIQSHRDCSCHARSMTGHFLLFWWSHVHNVAARDSCRASRRSSPGMTRSPALVPARTRSGRLMCLPSSRTKSASHPDQVSYLATAIHTIFEGTSEIQQLVIARAISGLRVE
jgi:hypothetical protein